MRFFSCRNMITIGMVPLFIWSCGGERPPLEKISVAEQMVSMADNENAAQYAPLDIRLAREKLQQAKAALDDKEYAEARRLADQASVDAQVAEAKATTEKGRRAVEELRQSIETLRREIDRSVSEQQPTG